MRNNIELTHIADNKANVLLSLNALMLTFLLPIVIPYFDYIKAHYLYIPMGILVVTCIVTIYLAILVLKPGGFKTKKTNIHGFTPERSSPFFFGNYYNLTLEEFQNYITEQVAEREKILHFITEDLHYIGRRLGEKMEIIKRAFYIFMIGFFTSIFLAIVLLFIPTSI